MTRSCEAGGKLDVVPEGALGFERVVMGMLRVIARCDRAKEAVRAKSSDSDDFLSNEAIEEKIRDLDRNYLGSREALIKMLMAHKAIRSIHESRIENERRAQVLKQAEEKFL